MVENLHKGFVKGEWYNCRINRNLYRYAGIGVESTRASFDLIINPTNELIDYKAPKSIIKYDQDDILIEYFNPSNLASMDTVNKYITTTENYDIW